MNILAPVAIITDSAACLPKELCHQYRIDTVPYYVHIGQQSYLSGKDLQPETFFERLRAAPEVAVSTGAPPIQAFLSAYQKVSTWAKAAVSIHIAGKQSNGCNAAELASRESPIPVVVIDSETTGMAEGFVALEAARAAANGESLEQVASKARAVVPNVGVIALLENVAFVLRGGRLGGAARVVSDFLKIQPMVSVQHNRVSLCGQVRRRSQGLKALTNKILDEVRDAPTHLAVHYAEDETEGRTLLEALKARVNCVEQYLTRVPIELGAHAGPGVIAVAYYVEKETLDLKQQLSRFTEYAKEAIRSRLP
ncbi:MAG TPA: DegV family protein [Anaerolineae bacterium]|nr:DegV family protein [Anaerolineae bacterium]